MIATVGEVNGQRVALLKNAVFARFECQRGFRAQKATI